mmetsp:Transcript_4363/g.10524  ORF Transcript_4363/g.10524 Transcript_4363/m.10524 type:complete len:231 (+) Transcript_4363:2795-3487(+)
MDDCVVRCYIRGHVYDPRFRQVVHSFQDRFRQFGSPGIQRISNRFDGRGVRDGAGLEQIIFSLDVGLFHHSENVQRSLGCHLSFLAAFGFCPAIQNGCVDNHIGFDSVLPHSIDHGICLSSHVEFFALRYAHDHVGIRQGVWSNEPSSAAVKPRRLFLGFVIQSIIGVQHTIVLSAAFLARQIFHLLQQVLGNRHGLWILATETTPSFEHGSVQLAQGIVVVVAAAAAAK